MNQSVSHPETFTSKKPMLSRVSDAYHRISSVFGSVHPGKQSNKIPEEPNKIGNLEIPAEEPEMYETLFMMDWFDSMKLFQRFFPHNNFDVVLQEIKEKSRSAKGFPLRRNIKRIRKHKNNRNIGNGN